MLSYAGVDLPILSQAQIAEFSDLLDPMWMYEFALQTWPGSSLAFSGFRGALPVQPVKVGSLYWPAGASRFAVGHYAATQPQLDAIRLAIGPSGTGTLTIGDGVDSISVAGMRMLPARPLFRAVTPTTGGSSPSGLYLLTLVDQRFAFWFAYASGITGESWADLYSLIGAALGVSISVDAVPTAYETPPENLPATSSALPLLLDSVAWLCGQQVVCQFDGSVQAINANTGATRFQANIALASRLAGDVFDMTSGSGADLYRAIPSSVTVVFDQGTSSESSISIPGPGGFPGTKVLASCQDESMDLAVQWAGDWYAWQGMGLDALYSGAVTWDMDGVASLIEVVTDERMVSVRVQRGPWLDNSPEIPSLGVGVVWAKMTAQDAVTGGCAWTQQTPIADGGFEDTPDGMSGTTTENPAYPANLNVPVQIPFITQITPGVDGDWRFEGLPSWTLIGKASEDIAARTGPTPGSGTVAVYWNDSGTLTALLDSLGNPVTLTAYNISDTEVLENAWLALMYDGDSDTYFFDGSQNFANTILNLTNTAVNLYGVWAITSGQTWQINGPGLFYVNANIELCGRMEWCYATVPQFESSVEVDYDFGGVAQKIVYRVTPASGGTTLVSMKHYSDGHVIVLLNVSDTDDLVIQQDDGMTGTADFRFILPGLENLTLVPGDGIEFWWDPADERWRDMADTIATAGVAGSGTLNYIAKWTPDGVTLGDSTVTDGVLTYTNPYQTETLNVVDFLDAQLRIETPDNPDESGVARWTVLQALGDTTNPDLDQDSGDASISCILYENDGGGDTVLGYWEMLWNAAGGGDPFSAPVTDFAVVNPALGVDGTTGRITLRAYSGVSSADPQSLIIIDGNDGISGTLGYQPVTYGGIVIDPGSDTYPFGNSFTCDDATVGYIPVLSSDDPFTYCDSTISENEDGYIEFHSGKIQFDGATGMSELPAYLQLSLGPLSAFNDFILLNFTVDVNGTTISEIASFWFGLSGTDQPQANFAIGNGVGSGETGQIVLTAQPDDGGSFITVDGFIGNTAGPFTYVKSVDFIAQTVTTGSIQVVGGVGQLF